LANEEKDRIVSNFTFLILLIFTFLFWQNFHLL